MVCLPEVERLPRHFEDSARRLRTLDLVGCVPEPANGFCRLSAPSLGPLNIKEFDDLLLVVEDSPDLEHFDLQQGVIGTPEEP